MHFSNSYLKPRPFEYSLEDLHFWKLFIIKKQIIKLSEKSAREFSHGLDF